MCAYKNIYIYIYYVLRTNPPFCDAVSRVPERWTPNQGVHLGKREDPTLGHGITIGSIWPMWAVNDRYQFLECTRQGVAWRCMKQDSIVHTR